MHKTIRDCTTFHAVWEALRRSQSVSASGLWDSSKAALAAYVCERARLSVLVVTAGQPQAERFAADASFFSQRPVYLFPAWETLPHEKIAPHVEIVAERSRCLDALDRQEGACMVIAPVQALLQKVLSREDFAGMVRELMTGDEAGRKELLEYLVLAGYRRETAVQARGEFAVRGGLCDLFLGDGEYPVRIEFDADTIASMRRFEIESQVSFDSVDRIRILPVCELEFKGGPYRWVSFESRMNGEYLLMLDGAAQIRRTEQEIAVDRPGFSRDYISLQDMKPCKKLYVEEMAGTAPEDATEVRLKIERSSAWSSLVPSADEPLGYKSELFDRIAGKTSRGYRIHFVARRQAELQRLDEILKEKGVWRAERHQLHLGALSCGFVLPQEMTAILTDREIFGRSQNRSLRAGRHKSIPVSEFSDFKKGDTVVHLAYGIGKFLQVSTLNERGIAGEYLTIEYAGRAKLYVPVDQTELVEKYVGIRGRPPRLNKLGGKEWERTKEKTLKAVKDYAAQMLSVHAARASLSGYAFGPDTSWQKEFEASFIYEETPDQLQAITEVKKDMEKPKPMDRLICGDVGFGKTEVAIRAAFKVALEGKQVAVLVPTTVLAQQHYYTFRQRFSGYPIEVEMLSRFRKASHQEIIVRDLKRGTIDVIIGTHRLLAEDVEFKDLGLVIVDEEQRFGVVHKEKLKRLRFLVDVLTMTATPIPRTLYLSLMRTREMSLINTPPEDRLPIETVIAAYNEELVRDGLIREIGRGGQVFYVHNRIRSIHRVMDRLRKLVPQARFAVAHGQMPEDELERIMRDFISGAVQVLVSTNIVESGLDIPNANTIIVDHAERFGLADLYQLRGRVGRYHRRAYAYFLYSTESTLAPEAKTRLKTIEEFTELGSGFRIAMRDLEIRGAGNILGREQHGHISAVGFSLYCRLLDNAVRKLRKEKVREAVPVTVQLGFEMAIPPSYLDDFSLRIETYRKIFEGQSPADFQRTARELADRFGPLPPQVLLMLDVAELKALARDRGVTSIQVYKDRAYFRSGNTIRAVERCDSTWTAGMLVSRLRRALKEKIPRKAGTSV